MADHEAAGDAIDKARGRVILNRAIDCRRDGAQITYASANVYVPKGDVGKAMFVKAISTTEPLHKEIGESVLTWLYTRHDDNIEGLIDHLILSHRAFRDMLELGQSICREMDGSELWSYPADQQVQGFQVLIDRHFTEERIESLIAETRILARDVRGLLELQARTF